MSDLPLRPEYKKKLLRLLRGKHFGRDELDRVLGRGTVKMNEKSAGFVAFRKFRGSRRYLLLHYEEGHWDFPKGHLERREGEEGAARRELLEETGIGKVDRLIGFREKIHYFYRRKGKLMSKDVVFFLGEVRGATVKLSSEHVGSAWLGFEDAVEKLTYKTAKGILEKAEHFLERRTAGLV